MASSLAATAAAAVVVRAAVKVAGKRMEGLAQSGEMRTV
jgi:hypothetical protein